MAVVPKIIIVALDYYREPLRFAHLTNPHRPLPSGITDVLTAPTNILSEENIEGTAAALNATVSDCREAIPFFVKQVLLDSGGDYYRMLGLSRNADVSQIKEHYRYLIRLFHPDRDVSDDNWDELYAPRINQAYNTLRNADRRRDYDASLYAENQDGFGPEASQAAKSSPQLRPTRVKTASKHRATISPKARNLAIGLFAILVMALVLLVVKQTNQPALRVQVDETHEPAVAQGNHSAAQVEEITALALTETKPEKLPEPTASIEPVKPIEIEEILSTEEHIRRQVEQATIAVLGRPAPKPVVEKQTRAVKPPTVAEVVQKHKNQTTQLDEAVPSGPSASSAKIMQQAELDVTEEVMQVASMTSTPNKVVQSPKPDVIKQAITGTSIAPHETVQKSKPQTVQPVEARIEKTSASTNQQDGQQAEIDAIEGRKQAALAGSMSKKVMHSPTDTISDKALFRLLASFIASYEAGNLDQFVGLFSDDAYTTDATGYRAIYKLYKGFFSRPERRKISIAEFNWRDDTNGGKVGSGILYLTTTYLNGQKPWNGDGTLKLEVRQAVNDLKITGMYYEIYDK